MNSGFLFVELDLKGVFSSVVLKEGRRWFMAGNVVSFSQDGGAISGAVRDGDETFDCVFRAGSGSVFCSCELGKKCVHLAALCFYYLESVSAKKSKLGMGLKVVDQARILPDDVGMMIETDVLGSPLLGLQKLKKPVTLGFYFSLGEKGILLGVRWVFAKSDVIWPLGEAEVLGSGNSTVLVYGNEWATFSDLGHVALARPFLSVPERVLDGEKFRAFLDKKKDVLKDRGVILEFEKGIRSVRTSECLPVLGVTLEGLDEGRVGVDYGFWYGEGFVSGDSSQSACVDLKKRVIYSRDLDEEARLLVPVRDFFEHDRVVLSGQRLFGFLDLLRKLKSVRVEDLGNVRRRYAFSQTKIVPKIGIKQSGKGLFLASVRFLKQGNPFDDVRLLSLLKKGGRYLFDEKVFLVEGIEELRFLLRVQAWAFPVSSSLDLGAVYRLYQRLGVYCQFEKSLESMLGELNSLKGFQLSSRFNRLLHGYQKVGVNWMMSLFRYGFGGLLADDMGLGKTLQTLVFLNALKDSKVLKGPVLVVMPKTLLFNWEQEIGKFFSGVSVLRYEGRGRETLVDSFKRMDFILVSYPIFRLDERVFRAYGFGAIVLDEAQMMKNPESKISKALRRLEGGFRLALTGTPVENYPRELWSIFDFLNPGYLGKLSVFQDEIEGPILKGDDEVKARLRMSLGPLLLRRMKDDVMSELPEKTEQVLFVGMSAEQQKIYEEVRQASIRDIHGKSRFHIFAVLTKLRQLCIHPKLVDGEFEGGSEKWQFVRERIRMVVAEGHKVVLFSSFVKAITLLKKGLDEDGVLYSVLTGQTRDREKAVSRFQDNADVGVFLVSLKAGGVGLNLTAADYVFLLDPWWNPAVEAQAVDRVHRQGQVKPVFVYQFITSDSVESRVYEIQQQKKELAKGLFLTEAEVLGQLSDSELSSLL